LTEENKRFQLGMNSFDISPSAAIWQDFLGKSEHEEQFIDEMIEKGKVIESWLKTTAAQMMEDYSFEIDFEGHKALCMNSPLKGSLNFLSKWDPSKHDFMIKFNWDGKRQKWEVSLYAHENNKIDLSTIAKKYGGGGHAGAAGFTAKELPFKLG
jgi:hypothetical protein